MAVARQKVYIDRFKKLQTLPGFQNLRTYQVQPGEVVRFEFTVIARQTDELNRGTFTRVILLYRKGSDPVKVQGPLWEASSTIKSSVIMDLDYTLGADHITVRSKNPANTSTLWAIQAQKFSLIS